MNYFPALQSDNDDLDDLISALERANVGIFDEYLHSQGAKVISTIKGEAVPYKFDKYFLHDALKVSDALFIFNGLLPPSNKLLESYVFNHQFKTVNTSKNTHVIDKALNYCKQEIEIYENSKTFGYFGVSPMVGIQRLDGLSTCLFKEFPNSAKFENITTTKKTQNLKRTAIEEAFTFAIIKDLYDRIEHTQKHITLWNTSTKSLKPSLKETIDWAQSKGFKSDWLHYLKQLEQKLDDLKSLNETNNLEFKYEPLISKSKNRAKAVENFLARKKLPLDWSPNISLPALWDVLEREKYLDTNGRNIFSSGKSNAYKFFKDHMTFNVTLGNK